MVVQKPREIAARVLREREQGIDFVENLLANALAQTKMSPPDRSLCQELVYGVARWQATLDWLIERKTASRPQRAGLRILLRLGLYQILWLDRIPDHAAVNETVELAKQQGFPQQAGFVNAMLRTSIRERDQTRKLLANLKGSQPHLGYSHPAWLVERWLRRWERRPTVQLLEWNNLPAVTYARLNTLRTDGTKLIEAWRKENVEYDFCTWDWTGENLVFRLKAFPPLEKLPSFRRGFFYVQDPSTLLAVHLLDPQPGETVLDLCAAPGGKTSYCAQRMENQGRILAEDTAADRLHMVEENCSRLGVSCAQVRLAPTEPDQSAAAPPCDRAVVDAPCSNTGVMRRRVDLRWRVQPAEFARLCKIQRALLWQAAPQLKPGGVLVYSTCSLEPEENGEVVKRFLAEHADFKLELEQELLPFADGVDGAYVARLKRV